MVDSRAFDDLPRMAPQQPDEIVAEARAAVSRVAATAGDAASGTVGAGASDDELIKATAGADGLLSLDVDQRAMKLPSVDLAAAIVQAVGRAESAYTDAMLAAVTPALPRMPTGQDMESLRQLGRAGTALPEQMREQFERFRQGTTG